MKKVLNILLFIIFIIVITGCDTKNEDVGKEKTKKENIEVTSVKVLINDKEYAINLENNQTVNEFVEVLPLELNMSELNGNEKYVYLNNSFSTNSINPKHINAGDVMLYGNNCLVIFYKSFDTSYSYTKIGHIDNLPDFGKDNIKIKIDKILE